MSEEPDGSEAAATYYLPTANKNGRKKVSKPRVPDDYVLLLAGEMNENDLVAPDDAHTCCCHVQTAVHVILSVYLVLQALGMLLEVAIGYWKSLPLELLITATVLCGLVGVRRQQHTRLIPFQLALVFMAALYSVLIAVATIALLTNDQRATAVYQYLYGDTEQEMWRFLDSKSQVYVKPRSSTDMLISGIFSAALVDALCIYCFTVVQRYRKWVKKHGIQLEHA